MREPGLDTPGPLSEIQFRKGGAITLLQSQENVTHFRFRVAGNATIGVKRIYSSPEL